MKIYGEDDDIKVYDEKIQEIIKVEDKKIIYREIKKTNGKSFVAIKRTHINNVFLHYYYFTIEFRKAVASLMANKPELRIEPIEPKEPIEIEIETEIVDNRGYEEEIPIIPPGVLCFEEGMEEISKTGYGVLENECKRAGRETIYYILIRNEFYKNYEPVDYWYISKLSGEKEVIQRWRKLTN